ncbi:MAG: extracellular matrix regulator RemB [Acutalibacteraceae bacterium]
MYIHLGNNIMLPTNEIIGIFDLENASISKRTRDFLAKAEKEGKVVTISYDLPRSFVIAGKNRDDIKVYISQISSSTLLKRTGYIDSL